MNEPVQIKPEDLPDPEIIRGDVLLAGKQYCLVAGIELTTLGIWILKDPALFTRRLKTTDFRMSTYKAVRDFMLEHPAKPGMRGQGRPA